MIKAFLGVVGVLLFAASVEAQTVILPDCRIASIQKNYADGDFRVTVRCERNGSQQPVVGDKAQILRLTQPPPPPVNCAGTWSAWAPTGDWGVCVGGTQTRPESRAFTVTTPPSGGGLACPASPETRTASQSCTVDPPGEPIWGVSDPAILGDFTAAEHDVYTLSGGDGFKYRTWHPQCVGGRCFAHEHGDNPSIFITAQVAQVDRWIAQAGNTPELAALRAAISRPVLFGWIGRRMPMPNEPNGHEEPHEGFKVFGANPGERNDENRTNTTWSLSTYHMGTGGPRRFTTQHHSADLRLLHPSGAYAATRVLMNTGGTGIVCDPRQGGDNKDVVAIDFVQRCNGKKLGSLYEIWSTGQDIRSASGAVVYRVLATPAAFDPVTAFNPANPAEVVYIGGVTDPRVQALKEFPGDDWSHVRGCNRESYAQPGLWYNAGGVTSYLTDAMGNPASGPLAIQQIVSRTSAIGLPATGSSAPDEASSLGAFKIHVDWCSGVQYSGGQIPRAGVAGAVNKSKLGLKN